MPYQNSRKRKCPLRFINGPAPIMSQPLTLPNHSSPNPDSSYSTSALPKISPYPLQSSTLAVSLIEKIQYLIHISRDMESLYNTYPECFRRDGDVAMSDDGMVRVERAVWDLKDNYDRLKIEVDAELEKASIGARCIGKKRGLGNVPRGQQAHRGCEQVDDGAFQRSHHGYPELGRPTKRVKDNTYPTLEPTRLKYNYTMTETNYFDPDYSVDKELREQRTKKNGANNPSHYIFRTYDSNPTNNRPQNRKDDRDEPAKKDTYTMVQPLPKPREELGDEEKGRMRAFRFPRLWEEWPNGMEIDMEECVSPRFTN